MIFRVEHDWVWSKRANSYGYGPEFKKFNHAVAELRRQIHHSRLVIVENGKSRTIMLFEPTVEGTRPYPPHKVKSFLKLSNGLYLHSKLVRTTSKRRKPNENSKTKRKRRSKLKRNL